MDLRKVALLYGQLVLGAAAYTRAAAAGEEGLAEARELWTLHAKRPVAALQAKVTCGRYSSLLPARAVLSI